MSDKIIAGNDCLMYKGKPLVRNNDSFCYGNMTDKCVLFMQVMTYREVNGEQRAKPFLSRSQTRICTHHFS